MSRGRRRASRHELEGGETLSAVLDVSASITISPSPVAMPDIVIAELAGEPVRYDLRVRGGGLLPAFEIAGVLLAFDEREDPHTPAREVEHLARGWMKPRSRPSVER
jgi:hypothetical protein